MKFEVAPLPYAHDALAPHIGARTVEFHYEKHHKGYMEKLRKALEGKSEAELSLEEIIRHSDGSRFNNAAQVWNHDFYWQSLDPAAAREPTGPLADAIRSSFQSVDSFKRQMAEVANGQFGSGWTWLVLDRNGRLRVTSTTDAENPLATGHTPLLTMDVWEHAYYLDYQNDRAAYVESVLDHLLAWDFAARNLEAARRS